MKVPGYAMSILAVVLVFYLLIVGEALLLPLVIAIAIWYLINTLAAQFSRLSMGRHELPRWLCLVLSLLTFVATLWAIGGFLGGRLQEVMQVIPLYQANLTLRLETLPFLDMAAYQERGLMPMLTEWIDLPAYAASIASSFAGILASGGLISIYVLFLFLEQGKFDGKISALFNRDGQEADVRKIIDRVRNDIQKYISIKMFTSSLTGVLSYLYLRTVDVDFAGVWGLVIFLLNFIPTVGSIVATVFPAMIALAQSDGYSLFVLVLVGIGALQVGIGNILEPRLMGSSFNLSPIVILLNLGLWGYIWGIPGMFLCVPFLIILTIILSHFPQTRYIAVILSSDGKLRVPADELIDDFNFTPNTAALLGRGADDGRA